VGGIAKLCCKGAKTPGQGAVLFGAPTTNDQHHQHRTAELRETNDAEFSGNAHEVNLLFVIDLSTLSVPLLDNSPISASRGQNARRNNQSRGPPFSQSKCLECSSTTAQPLPSAIRCTRFPIVQDRPRPAELCAHGTSQKKNVQKGSPGWQIHPLQALLKPPVAPFFKTQCRKPCSHASLEQRERSNASSAAQQA